jgi:uncharacterized protein with GYD domain
MQDRSIRRNTAPILRVKGFDYPSKRIAGVQLVIAEQENLKQNERHASTGESIMQTFVLLTRLSPEALKSPTSLEDFEKRAVERISQECPEVTWLHNYVLLGPYDYLDMFTAPDFDSALKVSALIRTFGRAHSEIWAATEWETFKSIIHSLPAH